MLSNFRSLHQIAHEEADARRAKKVRWPWENIVNKSFEGVFDSQNNNKKPERDSSSESKKSGGSGRSSSRNSDTENNKSKNNNVSSSSLNLRDSFTSAKSSSEANNTEQLRAKFKPRPKKPQKNIKLASQKFAYNKTSGYIYSMENPNLVFGVSDVENSVNEVFLMRKSEENINQRWIFKPNGAIVSKTRPNLALTVKLPALENIDVDLNERLDDLDPKAQEALRRETIMSQCSITLQQFIDVENGNAHQKWRMDESIGFIYAFAADSRNIGEYFV